MCGIAGFVSDKLNKKEKNDILKKMCDRIKHRGPDGLGYYVDELVALGHRRLSIIDISMGSQPMISNDKNVIIVFNGEIYNYQELKKELTDYDFKTNSDTEVLLAGYLKWGIDLPSHLRGMFAFAIWDKKCERLFCARDYFGIKPFYYYHHNDTFMFASEIKSFLDHPQFKKEFNEKLIPSYLSFSFTPTNETFFKNVHRLDAGNILIWEKKKLSIKPYYNLEFNIVKNDYEKTVLEIQKTMQESVKYHMISDVEVGSFLSSGIDSSYIVSLAKPNKTYTVGYDIKKYDEISYAKDLAKRLNIKNISKKISKEEYMSVVKKILYHMDEPASDPAIMALYFVANLASRDVKVVLSGEGADEFFGGYNSYREEVDYTWYNKIPFFIRHIISKIAKLLPPVRGINFLVRRGEKLENYYTGVNPIWNEKEIKKILKEPITITNKEITKPIYDKYKDKSRLIKMQAIDIHFWLMKDILQKADRMTMANSIEGRVPFVDKEVFKIASSLPTEYKVTKENTKVALRDAAKKVIPNESYKKKKLGFPVPIREWLKEDDVYNEVKQTFETKTANQYFNTDILIHMLDNHKNGKQDNYRKLWNVYCFLKWYEVFFENELV